MTGFFFDIRSLFTARYSGRYFSMLLRELAFQEPATFARAFDMPAAQRKALVGGKLQIEREWRFAGAAGKRRHADLALLNGGEPVLVVEVKEDDVNALGNKAQLVDYLSLVQDAPADGVRFAHVSRYSPTKGDREAMKAAGGSNVKSYRYRDIHGSLTGEPFSRMLSDYLKDIGVTKYETIDLAEERKEVAFFLAQALGFSHKHGLGRLHSRKAVTATPAIIEKMFGNLEVLGEWLKNGNQSLLRQSSSRKFRPYPAYDIKGLGKAIAEIQSPDGEWQALPGNYGQYVKSGTVYFSTHGSIWSEETKKNDWLYYEIGIGLTLEKNPEDKDVPVGLSLYAGFGGNGLKWTETWKEVAAFPTEQQAMKHFGRLLTTAKQKAIAADEAGTHASLRSFAVPN